MTFQTINTATGSGHRGNSPAEQGVAYARWMREHGRKTLAVYSKQANHASHATQALIAALEVLTGDHIDHFVDFPAATARKAVSLLQGEAVRTGYTIKLVDMFDYDRSLYRHTIRHEVSL